MKSTTAVLVCFTVSLYGGFATGQDNPAPKAAAPPTVQQSDSAALQPSNSVSAISKPKPGVQRVEAAPRIDAMDLLQRSHGLGEQLPLRDRLNTLQRQVRAAARLDPSLARAWANELIEGSNDLPDPDERAASQAGVVVNLALRDVEGALEIFRSLPTPSSTKASRDPRAMAAQILFPALLSKGGATAMPTIEREAMRLGSEDAYPYSAMAQVAVQSGQDPKSVKDEKDSAADARLAKSTNVPDSKPRHSGVPQGATVPRRDPAREATVLRICRQALSFYQSSTRSLAGDLDFADMLTSTWQWLPADFVRSALHTSADNLIASAAESDLEFQNSSENSADSSKDQKIHQNLADLALVQVAPMLRKLDPDALEKVKQARPFVAQSLQPTPQGGVPMWMTGTSTPSSGDDAMLNIQRTAQSDPNRALIMSQDLTDPAAKAQALSTVASAFASQDSQQALRTLEQADKLTTTVKDKEEQLRLLISEAEAAAAIKNIAFLRQIMARAFELADQITRAEEDARAEQLTGWRPLMRLVSTGMKLEPELTVAYIDHLNTPLAKANLLLAAAESIPLRQDSRQKPTS